MVHPTGSRLVICPICADKFAWPDDNAVFVYDEHRAQYSLVDTSRLTELKRADLLANGYVRCPNPARDTSEHYLPARYASYLPPLIVGLVGAPVGGKTMLLTAMIHDAYRGGLAPYGVQVSSLDFRRHDYFRRRFIAPFEQRQPLEATPIGIIEPADILIMRSAAGTRPVVFFDVAGEDLVSTTLIRSTRFLQTADAVIFVHPVDDPAGSQTPWCFELATERLLGRPGGGARIPVAIAVTKSDLKRFEPPFDHWLRMPEPTALDAAQIRAQSRDAYAYLHAIGATASLRPYDAFHRCTLHFVSAAGSRPNLQGFRPTHVLDPLVAILAMTGVIADPQAEKVGLP